MYQASSQQHRKVVAAAARSAKPPKSMRVLDWPRFLQAYYGTSMRPIWPREPKELPARLVALDVRGAAAPNRLVRVFNPNLRERLLAAHRQRW
jgi:hypothetical protein